MPNDCSPIRHSQLFELLRQQNTSATFRSKIETNKKQAELDESTMIAFRDLAVGSWLPPEPPEPAA